MMVPETLPSACGLSKCSSRRPSGVNHPRRATTKPTTTGTTTAVTIASSGGYINTLLGSVIPLAPIFAPYLALLLLLFRRFLLSIMVFLFAAFITPSPITLPQTVSLAAADWHHLADLALSFPLPHSQIIIAAVILVLTIAIISPLLVYHRELVEVGGTLIVIIVAAALLFAAPGARNSPSTPAPLRLASASQLKNEQQLVMLTFKYWPIAIAIVLSVLIITHDYSGTSHYPRLLSATVAAVATFLLFPYVSSIYPFPHRGSYYSEVLHELWLPAERIVMRSGHIYYGYILTSDPTWDTVLQTNRTIVYLHADEVERRSVCQPRATPPSATYRPLIPLLYATPAPTPPCTRSSSFTTIPSVLSDGQSLKAISLKAHTWPWHIISLTNAIERGRLSASLSTYESKHNWNAPTPRGQRFWYNPPITH